MIKPGEPWGAPTSEPPDLEVEGGDPELAAAAVSAPGALVRFLADPSSDLARAVGLRPGAPGADAGIALPVDALALTDGAGTPIAGGALAVNLCVLGTAPDRLRWSTPSHEVEVLLDDRPWFTGPATTVVVASGQFLRGNDLVPRGHPGDGRAEIQVYELRRGERSAMRARLATGAHLPHPRIRTRTAAAVEIRAPRPLPFEADGVARPPIAGLRIRVAPGAFRLLL